jgi:hypothetical protein
MRFRQWFTVTRRWRVKRTFGVINKRFSSELILCCEGITDIFFNIFCDVSEQNYWWSYCQIFEEINIEKTSCYCITAYLNWVPKSRRIWTTKTPDTNYIYLYWVQWEIALLAYCTLLACLKKLIKERLITNAIIIILAGCSKMSILSLMKLRTFFDENSLSSHCTVMYNFFSYLIVYVWVIFTRR